MGQGSAVLTCPALPCEPAIRSLCFLCVLLEVGGSRSPLGQESAVLCCSLGKDTQSAEPALSFDRLECKGGEKPVTAANSTNAALGLYPTG